MSGQQTSGGPGAPAGECERAVVKVDEPMHIVCFVLNIFVSGSGTVISAFFDPNGLNTTALVFGLLQFFLVWMIIPWIWSVIHGWWIYEKSCH